MNPNNGFAESMFDPNPIRIMIVSFDSTGKLAPLPRAPFDKDRPNLRLSSTELMAYRYLPPLF